MVLKYNPMQFHHSHIKTVWGVCKSAKKYAIRLNWHSYLKYICEWYVIDNHQMDLGIIIPYTGVYPGDSFLFSTFYFSHNHKLCEDGYSFFPTKFWIKVYFSYSPVHLNKILIRLFLLWFLIIRIATKKVDDKYDSLLNTHKAYREF